MIVLVCLAKKESCFPRLYSNGTWTALIYHLFALTHKALHNVPLIHTFTHTHTHMCNVPHLPTGSKLAFCLFQMSRYCCCTWKKKNVPYTYETLHQTDISSICNSPTTLYSTAGKWVIEYCQGLHHVHVNDVMGTQCGLDFTPHHRPVQNPRN